MDILQASFAGAQARSGGKAVTCMDLLVEFVLEVIEGNPNTRLERIAQIRHDEQLAVEHTDDQEQRCLC